MCNTRKGSAAAYFVPARSVSFFPAAVFVVTLRQCTLLHVVLVTEEL